MLTATLVYTANATGVSTAAQLAAAMQAAPLFSASALSLLGATLVSQIGTFLGNVATLTIVLDISSATFAQRFPSVVNNEGFGPFLELFTARLRSIINQPVLAATPVVA